MHKGFVKPCVWPSFCQIESRCCLLARDWQLAERDDLFVAAKYNGACYWCCGLAGGLRSPCVFGGGGSGAQSHEISASPASLIDRQLDCRLAECRCCSPTSSFGVLVRETALRVGVEPRALAVLALLHFPRVASYEGWVTRWQAEREVRISAERLRREARAARDSRARRQVPVT